MIDTSTTATAPTATPRKFINQLHKAIATALAIGVNLDAFVAEATIAYAELGDGNDDGNDDAAKLPNVYPDGYHDVPGCPHPVVSELPLVLGMELTPHQIDVIRTNTGCNARGQLVDHTGNPIPAYGLGFEGPTGGQQSKVSWKAATNFTRDPNDMERPLKGSQVPFIPRVVRMRGVTTLAEAAAAWAENKF